MLNYRQKWPKRKKVLKRALVVLKKNGVSEANWHTWPSAVRYPAVHYSPSMWPNCDAMRSMKWCRSDWLIDLRCAIVCRCTNPCYKLIKQKENQNKETQISDQVKNPNKNMWNWWSKQRFIEFFVEWCMAFSYRSVWIWCMIWVQS